MTSQRLPWLVLDEICTDSGGEEIVARRDEVGTDPAMVSSGQLPGVLSGPILGCPGGRPSLC